MVKKRKPRGEPKSKRTSSAKTGNNKGATGHDDQADPADRATASESVGNKETTQEPGAISIVGIGASAGGLDALGLFFKAMPANSGLSFVVVVHLDPKRDSLLPDLLQELTLMPVRQIKDGEKVEPDTIYVIPPDKIATYDHGILKVNAWPASTDRRFPIDVFFSSLAFSFGRSATCIILSGNGSDGTKGAQAIHDVDGIVLSQDEQTAKCKGMPHNVIQSGLADFVTSPDEMPELLMRHVKWHRRTTRLHAPITTNVAEALTDIFELLLDRTGRDFSHYKKNTICRRIERRMNVHQITDIAQFVRYLKRSDRELDILFNDLLIGVTRFFRDRPSFEFIQNTVLLEQLDSKQDDNPFRVWSAGCATGEEAYSLAIAMHEAKERSGRTFDIQVFATDIDEAAIRVARLGKYPASIAEDVGAERLRRFFDRVDEGYRVKKVIRETIVFAIQDVTMDPPFTKMDFLSCRNLLIYLDSELQQRLLPIFHYSLRPHGTLFLGSSESIGSATEMFAPLDKKLKVYRHQPDIARTRTHVEFPLHHSQTAEKIAEPQRNESMDELHLIKTVLQQSGALPCVIIDDSCNILYIHGRTGDFLEPAVGKVSVNILEMARAGIKLELTKAIREVATHKQEFVCRGLQITRPDGVFFADITVKPAPSQAPTLGMMIVVFEETTKPSRKETTTNRKRRNKPAARTAAELELELQRMNESLQATVEELETSNEEQKSTNEELQSTNEELQSTNEELETSKEELQSLNEESATVNSELQARIDELAKTYDDMKNLLDSTALATVFLDIELKIRRFTPSAVAVIPLTESDIGRPIGDLSTALIDADLTRFGKQVLDDLAIRTAELKGNNQRDYKLTVRPYRTAENVIDGVVITFEDVTERKRIDDALRESEQRFRTLFELSNDAVVLVDTETLRFVEANQHAHQNLGYTHEEFLNLSIIDIEAKQDEKEIRSVVKKLINKEHLDFVTLHRTRTGEIREVQVRIRTTEIAERKFLLSTWKPHDQSINDR